MVSAITIAFGNRLDRKELRRILRGSFYGLWVEVLGLKPCRIDARSVANARIIGWEHLEQALAGGKGVILFEHGGFGRRLLAKQIMADKGVRLYQIRGADHLGCLETFQTENTWLRARILLPFFHRAEIPYYVGFTCIPGDGDISYARKFLSELARNGVLVIAADGPYGTRRLSVPFLGTKFTFSTGMANLARLSGASILPVLCREDADGRLCLLIEEAIRPDQDEDRERCVERMIVAYANLMERYIRRYPAEFRNWHVLARGGD